MRKNSFRENVSIVTKRASVVLDTITSLIPQIKENHAPSSVSCCHCGVSLCSPEFSGELFNIRGAIIHAECLGNFMVIDTKTCGHCNKAIVFDGANRGGFYILYDKNVHIHAECHLSYLDQHYPKCNVCGEHITLIPDRFSGQIVKNEDSVAHKECVDEEQEQQQDQQQQDQQQIPTNNQPPPSPKDQTTPRGSPKKEKCRQCFGQIVAGTTAMRYQNGDLVHAECVADYVDAISERCKHCRGPINIIEGKFSGEYYIVGPGDKKVHAECLEAFQSKGIRRGRANSVHVQFKLED